MSSVYATDTMALILRLEKRILSYLSERIKIDTNLNEVQDYCQKFPTATIELITDEIIYRSFEIDDIPELHDRIIAGTASLKNLELITDDLLIIKSKFVSTVW